MSLRCVLKSVSNSSTVKCPGKYYGVVVVSLSVFAVSVKAPVALDLCTIVAVGFILRDIFSVLTIKLKFEHVPSPKTFFL